MDANRYVFAFGQLYIGCNQILFLNVTSSCALKFTLNKCFIQVYNIIIYLFIYFIFYAIGIFGTIDFSPPKKIHIFIQQECV